ncbi:hypothetical protein HJFPF1_00053 [Paramyrothecium foliicola]|nr:hypothetical protein HJFPF1_00053 [Paramyrothecium foliicola]
MPSSTALYNIDFVNLGPLTTTYTAPAACATSNNIAMARLGSPGFPRLFEKCDLPTYGDCVPNGRELDEDEAERYETHGQGRAIYYHQPASICPDAWTTAGVAAKGSDGKVSSSGIYVPPSDLTELPGSNPTPNIFMEALNPGETAVVCCPSGFTANAGVGCHSIMPQDSYTATEVCSKAANEGWGFETVIFTYDGQVVTGVAPTETGRQLEQATLVTAAPRASTVWNVASYIPAVTLVRGGEEGLGDGESSGSPEPTETKPAEAETKATETEPTGFPSLSRSIIPPLSFTPKPSPDTDSGDNGDTGSSSDDDDAGNEAPPSLGNHDWGNLSKIVTTVWALAAVSGLLIAAL